MRRMFVARRVRTGRIALVGAGVIAAGAIAMFSSGGSETAEARIGGAPLEPSEAPASEVATFANLAETTPLPAIAATAAVKQGPATVDLDTIERDGDHYVATMGDGRHAVLTLDPALQQLAEKLLDESRAPRGAIVAMSPDGRILALAGRRTKDNAGSREGTFDWHLATDAWAPAASVFKLVTASALVSAGVDPTGKVCYHGGIRSVLEHNLRDDKRDSRCESLAYGVAHSNNAILGKLAFQKLVPKSLEAQAKRLGWTSALPASLALSGGSIGELVVPAAHDLAFAQTAAGFNTEAKLSVMGGAMMAATFAREGEQPGARLIASIDGAAVAAPPSHRVIAQDTARAVARMMVDTCDAGSAAKSFGRGNKIRVAGKTGTLARTEPFYMEHSWFVGYAPADKPEIVVAVLLGNPESWHLRGHEAARRMIDKALRPANVREKDRTSIREKRPRS
ncbi:MAG: penicillin-binding transpeptidase domain-containing protein [Kofleriaceae bacterium]